MIQSAEHDPSMTRVIATALLALVVSAGRTDVSAQDAEFSLEIEAPGMPLASGGEFDAAVLLDAADSIAQGWSLAVAHDGADLELVSAAVGAAAAGVRAGEGPEYVAFETAPAGGDGFTHAAVLSLEDRELTLPAGDDQELVSMRYRVLADPSGAEGCAVSTRLDFSNALGAPPVRTVVTFDGESLPVDTAGASVTVACPLTNVITRCEAVDEDVFLEWDFGAVDPAELDFLLLYRDGDLIETLASDATAYADPDLAAGVHEYTIFTFAFNESSDPTLLFTYCAVTVAPVTVAGVEPSAVDWRGGDRVTVTGSSFTDVDSTSVFLVGEDSNPIALDVVAVTSATALVVRVPEARALGVYGVRVENDLGDGELAGAFEYGFIRGRINGDRAIDISDPLRLLDFLFSFRSDLIEIRCRDAADVNDDGNVNIADASGLLDFLFKGGGAPQAPFATPGADPTPGDSFGCLE